MYQDIGQIAANLKLIAASLAVIAEQTGHGSLKIQPNAFPKSSMWKLGDRVERVGYSGSYPDPTKNRPATVVGFEDYLIAADSLIVKFDDETEPRAINPDVLRHIKETP